MLVWNFTVGNAYMFLWNYFFKTLVKLDHFCKEAMKLHIYLYIRTVTCFLLGLWTMSRNTVSILSKSLCVKSVPIRSFFWSAFCHKTPYSDTFHAVSLHVNFSLCQLWQLRYASYWNANKTLNPRDEWLNIN